MQPVPSIGVPELIVCGTCFVSLIAIVVAVVVLLLVVYRRQR